MIEVYWGNKLECLADGLFAKVFDAPARRAGDVLARRACVVVPGGVVKHWIQHHYMYAGTDAAVPRVLMNCDFPLLNVFVNDWLSRMDHPDEAARDPASHPFSVESMHWRIYRLLGDAAFLNGAHSGALKAYLGAVQPGRDQAVRRRFHLAGRVAALMDEYMVYRPEMLHEWMTRRPPAASDASLLWQYEIWNRLTQGEAGGQSYLAAFLKMEQHLAECRIRETYDAVHVFGATMMPRVYAAFFEVLSRILPVRMYMLNPSGDNWLEQLTPRQAEVQRARLRLEGVPDELQYLETGNPVLAANGKGAAMLLGELIDLTGGQAEGNARFVDPGADTLLHAAQSAIVANSPAPEGAGLAADDSVQLHICHSPLREVEVLRDHLLRWFTADRSMEPRHVQVHVADLALYVPYIDAVFGTLAKSRPDVVPYVIADRVSGGETMVAEAFKQLLDIGGSRLEAPWVLQLLECESVREAFRLSAEDVADVAGWVDAAGIRWGWDEAHRKEVAGVSFSEATTWRRGLDRLLVGYAAGAGAGDAGTGLLPCDRLEGANAQTMGRFMGFMDSLMEWNRFCGAERTLREWGDCLDALVQRFFASTNTTYQDVGVLRSAVKAIRASAEGAGVEDGFPVGLAVVRDALTINLDTMIGGDDMVGNAVVFSAFRVGSSAPRRVVCMLGMGDGLFPRVGNRPGYDLFRKEHRRGDRSPRMEDRMAFLEALCSAGDRLYISYVGRSESHGKAIPPSVLVKELCEYLKAPDGTARHREVVHRLQSFHSDYFRNEAEPHFSYSERDCETARVLAGEKAAECAAAVEGGGVAPERDAKPVELDLEELIRFFKNPARAYYRDVLGVRLEPAEVVTVRDSEEFELDGLVGYAVNTAIVEAQLTEPPREQAQVYAELAERGQVPLGRWGERWFGEQWVEIDGLLSAHSDELAETLRAALVRRRTYPEAPCFCELAGGRRLSARVLQAGDGSVVDYRMVRGKAKDRMESWLRHLCACATGQHGRRFFVAGRDDEKERVTRFPRIERETACDLLSLYVDAWVEGQCDVIPFAPETSYAYADGYRSAKIKKGDPEEDDAEVRNAEGMKKAAGEWESGFQSRGEDADPYMSAAFTVAGPHISRERFAGYAARLCNPILEAAAAFSGEVGHG
jgi:exodeoxyribonuclease V gamma subunit